MRSGDVWLKEYLKEDNDGNKYPGSAFESAGGNGKLWSSWARSYVNDSYYFGFYADEIAPSNYVGRFVGYSLRCLSTVLD